ncbi:MAG: energy-coupling factor ABC transporter ATP-binding protein [Bdellovibrio bacteriovorus]
MTGGAPLPGAEPLLELRGVGFRYGGRPVLEGVDLRLGAGERVALIGPNGSGKTTLLHLLVGLQVPAAGEVTAFGRVRRVEADFHDVRTRVGLVFQDADDQLFCPTVLEDLAFGPLNLGRSPRQARADAERTLDLLGLAGFANRVTHRLSAGEKRLVALGTVLAMDPQVLLLDEPTNGLDEATEARLTDYLAAAPQAMLIVSHDRRFLERLATRALVLQGGRLAQAEIHRHPHSHSHSHLHIHIPGGPAEHGPGARPHGDHHAGHPQDEGLP